MRYFLFAIPLLALVGCGGKQPPLPVYGEVPQFVLTAQTGEEFHSENLRGKIWVADFIFTNCAGPCPRMSSQMRRIQDSVKDLPDVRLVSFSIDPARDTPEVLRAYAQRYRAEPGRWYFLTGPQQTVHNVSRHAFKLSDVDSSLNHSTRFVLIDQRGKVRGYYGSTEDDGLKPLIADIRRLSREQG
jgi:protein SCO1/2